MAYLNPMAFSARRRTTAGQIASAAPAPGCRRKFLSRLRLGSPIASPPDGRSGAPQQR
ncbi:hypothetical protein KFK09_022151 [Dendrobium nobile]|uniref:Uncharacterized protein n=1 Tax=Dendrobium nobile TaxID=94219 RepID=A0A8T3AIF2_DENNO|nr:hypothetical protein KFK09_022151 [Dendrobium nobile]